MKTTINNNTITSNGNINPMNLRSNQNRARMEQVNADYEEYENVSLVRNSTPEEAIIPQISGALKLGGKIAESVNSCIKTFEHNLNPSNALRFNESNIGEVKQGAMINGDGKGNVAPVALRQDIPNSSPHFMESSPGTVRIQHREMISAVTGTAGDDFSVSYRIQPANRVTFPWLHRIANLFESYTFHMLRILYVPRVPTSYAGQIGLALDFDADDDPSLTLSEYSQYQNSVIGSVWAGLSLTVEGENLQKCVRERYTDHNIAVHAFDPLLHDVANLRVATLTTPVEVLGQIYVEYDITLRTPEPNGDKAATSYFKITAGTGPRLFEAGASILGSTNYGVPPSTIVYKNEVPFSYTWSPSAITAGLYDVHLKIDRIGRYLLTYYVAFGYAAGEWDDGTKALANLSTGNAMHGHGYSLYSHYPIQAKSNVDITYGGGGTAYMWFVAVVDITSSDNSINFYGNRAAGTGFPTDKAPSAIYVNILAYDGYDSMPALKGKSLNFPTLTPQQVGHPLGYSASLQTRDNKARRSVITLAKALGKGGLIDLPSIKRLKVKNSKVSSSKRDKARKKSKK